MKLRVFKTNARMNEKYGTARTIPSVMTVNLPEIFETLRELYWCEPFPCQRKVI